MNAGNNGDTHAGDDVSSLTAAGGEITVAAGSNRAAYVVLNFERNPGPTAVAVTWNGTAMTQVAFAQTAAGSPRIHVYIFALANDSQVAADTTPAIAATWTGGAVDVYMSAAVFNGVQQSANGIDSANTVTDNTNDLTIDVTGTADGATLCTHLRNGGEPTTVGTGMTKFWGFDSFDPGGAGAYRIGLNGTNSYDFNSGSTGAVRASAAINVVSDGVVESDTLMPQAVF